MNAAVSLVFGIILFLVGVGTTAYEYRAKAADTATSAGVSVGYPKHEYIYNFGMTIDGPEKYIDLIKLMETAQTGDVITLHLAGYGGNADTAVRLINGMLLSKAEINTVVDGPVYSAHAWLAMAGKKITIAPYTFFMFHIPAVLIGTEYHLSKDACNSSHGVMDRGQDAYKKCVDAMTYGDGAMMQYFKDYVFKYTTEQERADIISGHDVYITGPDMMQRISTDKLKVKAKL